MTQIRHLEWIDEEARKWFAKSTQQSSHTLISTPAALACTCSNLFACHLSGPGGHLLILVLSHKSTEEEEAVLQGCTRIKGHLKHLESKNNGSKNYTA